MNEEYPPTTAAELEKSGMTWVDLEGEDSINCEHKIGFVPLAGYPIAGCTKCGRTAEQIYLDRRLK